MRKTFITFLLLCLFANISAQTKMSKIEKAKPYWKSYRHEVRLQIGFLPVNGAPYFFENGYYEPSYEIDNGMYYESFSIKEPATQKGK